jgi:serine protease
MKQTGMLLSIAITFVLVFGLSVPPTSASSLGLGSAGVGQAVTQKAPPTDQIIIKYRAGSVAQAARMQAGQMQSLSDEAGVALTFLREMSGDANVLRLPEKLPVAEVQAISERLMELPDVEYAEADERAFPALVPNDSYYYTQWDLTGPQGINVQPAWDVTTGSGSLVIAVLDTGITNHTDLSGRSVPGYDFVIDAPSGNDGQSNGLNDRDSDPSDPGDWITPAEDASGYFAGCGVTDSTWHGTHVAGTIGAVGNNSAGIAGINWNSKILPVRVLGKCGGFISDIADGIRWAAGTPVSGVPSNASPAKVLNLSIWGGEACGTTYQNAIDAATAAGAVVVTIAGNNNDDASSWRPGNCTGVITVASTNSSGFKASSSGFGSTVEISAPGDMIYSTLNTGTMGPVADNYVYYWGTSMAAPHVAGVASLMLSRNPTLTPAQVLALLQSSARAFPGGSTCNTSTCGSGIVDAAAAVNAARMFVDVPVAGKEWMEPWIVAFKQHGVTTGCNPSPLSYCPENQVTRAEMAVFLLRAKHGAGYAPPPASHFFLDVPVTGKEWMEPWIDQYYREGMTTGCGSSNYCPENNVTRAEMAVFVMRALNGASWTPPPPTGVFGDVPVTGKEWMQPWIEAFYHAGITTGCGGGNYCPENNVTRAEMAVFLGRAYHFYP